MRRLIFIVLIFPFLCSCASPRPWTKQEKVAAGFFLLGHTADALTTSQLTDNGNYEMNPILGKYPSDSEVGIYFSLTAISAITLCHFYPSLRQPLLFGYGMTNFSLAVYNEQLNN